MRIIQKRKKPGVKARFCQWMVNAYGMGSPIAIQAFPETVFGSVVVSSRMRFMICSTQQATRPNSYRESRAPRGGVLRTDPRHTRRGDRAFKYSRDLALHFWTAVRSMDVAIDRRGLWNAAIITR